MKGYVHYCIMRILFFVGASFYTIGWEAFSDFPTVRRLVVGKRPSVSSDLQPINKLERSYGLKSTSTNGTLSKGLKKGNSAPAFHMQRTPPMNETSEEDFEFSPEHKDAHSVAQDEDQDRPVAFSPGEFSEDNNADSLRHDPSHSPRRQEGGRHRRRRRQFFREATLLAPLLGLIVCTIGMALVTGVCQVESISCESSVFLLSMSHPTGRLNRGIRFALFISFLQWVQAFFYLFPTWNHGLMATGFGKIWSLSSVPIWPIALGRLAQWAFMPAGTGTTRFVLGVIPHHSVDIVMIMVIKCWMLGACIAVLKKPELSGFDRKRRLIEDDDWREMSTLFKYWFLVPSAFHFVRGCFKFGFVGAQNDLLVIVCAYPLLLVTVWTVVWAVVVAPGAQLLLAGVVGCLSLASSICTFACSQEALGATIMVWLHLMRQYLKMFKGHASKKDSVVPDRSDNLTSPQGEAMMTPTASAEMHGASSEHSEHGSPASKMRAWHHKPGQVPQSPNPPERQFARIVIVVSGIIAVIFFGVLAFLAVVASIQKKIDWYPSTIWFERDQDPPALRVDHTISRLRLLEQSHHPSALGNITRGHVDPDPDGVSYSVCDHSWHGLSVLDYALLSLASYFNLADPNLPELLDGIFPKHTGLTWKLRKDRQEACLAAGTGAINRLFWMEVEVYDPTKDKPLLVIALRGTDPVRISDYIEDIRMWTEPVALSILSTVFPTVRAWPRRTVEMVITGIHDFLASLGMPDEKWSYLELVGCIARIPRDEYSQIVLTGHSLGGGMATVVAALTHLPVVSITPPGIYWSLAKHSRHMDEAPTGVEAGGSENHAYDVSKWMHHKSLTLVVENDWVNGIFDDHGGLVQMMTCDRSHESLELACHMLEGTICHLFNRCGDPLNRWNTCLHEYVLKDTVKTTATKVLRDVLPPNIEDRVSGLWERLSTRPSSPQEPGSQILGYSVPLLIIFFVVLPILGGVIEELLLV
jgi:lipase ATG15